MRRELAAGHVTRADVDMLAKNRSLTPLQQTVRRLPGEDAWKVYGEATPEEQKQIREAVAPVAGGRGGIVGALSRTQSGERAMLLWRLAPEATRRAMLLGVRAKVLAAKNLTTETRAEYNRELVDEWKRMRAVSKEPATAR